jgi:hypothetical protein
LKDSFVAEDLMDLALANLAWFDGEDAGDDSGLGCNRDYRDLRGKTWADVRRVLECERRLVADFRAGEWVPDEPGDGPEVEDLELGVASVVTALSALGCIPFTSCNGRAFGGEHDADALIVGFYARPKHWRKLVDLGRGSRTELQVWDGALWLQARTTEDMLRWAERAVERAGPSASHPSLM